MNLTIKALDKNTARELISWRYKGDYALYNVETEDMEGEIAYFSDPENHYYAIFSGDEMIGHCVFHGEARVAGADYSTDALDIGAGMRPDWTGQGKGSAMIAAIMAFGRKQYQAEVFRATIAAWNIRAQKATTQNGFVEISRFNSERTGMEFIIFLCEADSY